MDVGVRHVFMKDLTEQDIQAISGMMKHLDTDLDQIINTSFNLRCSVYDQNWYKFYISNYQQNAIETNETAMGFSIASVEDIPVGYVFWSESGNFQNGIQFNDIFVDPAWRRKGIALAMMKETIQFIKVALHVTNFELEVFTSNIPARKLYEKLGFNKQIKTVLLMS